MNAVIVAALLSFILLALVSTLFISFKMLITLRDYKQAEEAKNKYLIEGLADLYKIAEDMSGRNKNGNER